jgi:hypothetical protein
MIRNFLVLFILFFSANDVYGSCASPAGATYSLRYIVPASIGDVQLCGSFGWASIQVSDTSVSCSTPGQIRYNTSASPDRLEFCAGDSSVPLYTWRDATGVSQATACSQNGTIERNIVVGQLRVCVESDWKLVGP